MSPSELVAVLALVGCALVGCAVYRQTRVHEVVGAARFELAFLDVGAGLISGGLHLRTGVVRRRGRALGARGHARDDPSTPSPSSTPSWPALLTR